MLSSAKLPASRHRTLFISSSEGEVDPEHLCVDLFLLRLEWLGGGPPIWYMSERGH